MSTNDGAERADARTLADPFRQYRRTAIAEMADWSPGFDMTGVSISEADRAAGSPKPGDKIARNPTNHEDRWLVAADYFAANFAAAVRTPEVREAVEVIIGTAMIAYERSRRAGLSGDAVGLAEAAANRVLAALSAPAGTRAGEAREVEVDPRREDALNEIAGLTLIKPRAASYPVSGDTFRYLAKLADPAGEGAPPQEVRDTDVVGYVKALIDIAERGTGRVGVGAGNLRDILAALTGGAPQPSEVHHGWLLKGRGEAEFVGVPSEAQGEGAVETDGSILRRIARLCELDRNSADASALRLLADRLEPAALSQEGAATGGEP